MNLSFILRDLASLQGLGIFLYQSLGWKSKERSAESGCIINSVFHCLVSIDQETFKYGIHSLTQIALALCILNTIWNIIIIDARKCSVWVWSYLNVTNFEWGPNTLAKISYNGIKSDIKTEKIKKVIWIQC